MVERNFSVARIHRATATVSFFAHWLWLCLWGFESFSRCHVGANVMSFAPTFLFKIQSALILFLLFSKPNPLSLGFDLGPSLYSGLVLWWENACFTVLYKLEPLKVLKSTFRGFLLINAIFFACWYWNKSAILPFYHSTILCIFCAIFLSLFSASYISLFTV